MISGSLPPEFQLSPAGVISSGGQVTDGQADYTFTVQVTDAGSPAQTATQQLSLQVYFAPSITPPALPDATAGVAYSAQLTIVPDKADVAVSVTGPSSAKPGATVTDTITVTNKGPVAASKVQVELDSVGLASVKASTGGSTKSVTLLGLPLASTTWSVAGLASG